MTTAVAPYKITDRTNGLAHEFKASLFDGGAPTVFPDAQGNGMQIDITSSFTTGTVDADFIRMNLIGSTSLALPTKPIKDGQKLLWTWSGHFSNNVNDINWGSAVLDETVLGYDADNIFGQTSSDWIAVPAMSNVLLTGTQAMLAMVCDPVNNIVTRFHYDNTGTLLERLETNDTNVNGNGIAGGLGIKDGDDNLAFSSSIAPEYASICMFYFNDIPTDLLDGLAWMSANPKEGAYDRWR